MSEPPAGSALVTMGETMALLTHDETTPLRHARTLDVGIGGSESNVAIAAARLGVCAAWIGRVGDDEFGRLVTRELNAEGVRTLASVDPSRPTALMLKASRSSQSTQVTYYRSGSAGSALSTSDVDTEVLTSARVFHTSAITVALSPSSAEAVHSSIDVCRSAGTLISVDLNYRSALWGEAEARGEFRRLVAKADIVFATEREARMASNSADAASLAEELAAMAGGTAVVKRGEFGAVACIEGKVHRVEPVQVRTVDPVGAGDAFAAGYLTGLIQERSPEDALEWGALMGAWAVATRGDWQGLPGERELGNLVNLSDGVAR